MSFGARRGANLYNATQEQNPLADLFSADVVFGVQTLPIEDNPGASDTSIDAPRGEAPPSYPAPIAEPSPVASTRQTGADSKWCFWPSASSSCVVNLPDGSDVRSLWLPVVPAQIALTLGYGGGALMYQITLAGGEVVPIPRGTKMLTLSSISNAAKPDVWVFATADVMPPNKTGVTGPPLPISGSLSPYDSAILGTKNVEFYWPLSDASGAFSAKDWSANVSNATPTGGMALGSSPLVTDNTTSAQFDGKLGTYLQLNNATPGIGANPWSLEFFYAYTSFDIANSGQTTDTLLANDAAGPTQIELNKADQHLHICGVDTGVVVSTGVVHHFALTVDATGNTWTVYHDGKQVFQHTSGPMGTTSAKWQLFGRDNGGQAGPVGYAQKLAFYGRVLSAAEIASHWSYAVPQ